MPAAIGLDIGSSAVRAAQVGHGRRGSVLERFGQVQLPVGAVADGEIGDPDIVVDALRQLWRSFRFSGRAVTLGLANQQVIVRRLELPYMTEEELRSSLPLQVDGAIPIAVDDAVLDFCMLGETHGDGDDGQRQIRILLVAAQRHIVDELLDVVGRARLDVTGIDLDAFAVLRALTPPGLIGDGEGEMVVDVGGSLTDIVVHRNGTPHFVRTVLFGGETVTRGLMEDLQVDHDTAEELKLLDGLDLDERDEVAVHVRNQSQRLVDEIRGSVDYCAAQRDIPRVSRIVLTGGASQMSELPAQLADGLSLDIMTASPLDSLAGVRDADDETLAAAAPFLSVAVGLAMGDAT